MTPDFISLAHSSESAEAFEVAALELVGQVVAHDAAFFLVKGNEQAATVIGLDAATRCRALAGGAKYARDLMPVKRAALAARGVAVDTSVCGSSYVRKTSYYREVMSAVGGEHTLVAYLPWQGRIVAAMMLGRGATGFSAEDIAHLEDLLPALGLARAAYGLPKPLQALPAAPALSPVRRLLRGSTRVLASVKSPSGTLVVQDRNGFRELVASSGATQFVWTRVALQDSTRSGWPYVELFHLAPALARQRSRALFVGCGGAVAVRQFATTYPGMAIDVVEQDAQVIDLARAWFDLGAIPGVTVHLAEGAAFIRNAAPSCWDVIVIDAYDATSFAVEFAAQEFLACLRSALRSGGTVACNVIGTLAGPGPVRSFVSAARAVFDHVRVLPVVELDEQDCYTALRNVVVVATRAT